MPNLSLPLPLPSPVAILVGIVVLVVLDLTWIGSNMRMYNRLVERVQHRPLVVRWDMALIVYGFLITALVVFAMPLYRLAWWYPFLLGIVTYGVFNFTNKVMFGDYDLATSVIDTLWGGVILLATCALTYWIVERRP